MISPEALALIIALIIVAGVILFIPVLQKILKLSAYLYCNAKIRALEAGLIKNDTCKELIGTKSGMECISSMEDTDYGKYLTRVSEPITAIKLEKALNNHLKDIFEKVLRSVPTEDRDMFKQYLKLWDVKNIKSIMRGVRLGIPKEELEKYVIPIGTINDAILKTLIESKNMDEVVSGLESIEYGKVVSDVLQETGKEDTLLSVETALDKYVLENLYSKAAITSEENLEVVQTLIGTKADILNLKTAIKAVTEKVNRDDSEKYLVDIHYRLSKEAVKAAIGAGSMDELVNSIEGTVYSEIIGDELPEYRETKSIFKIENALDAFFSKTAKDLSLRHPLGAGPAFRLLVDKERDIRKIGGILKYKIEKSENVEDLNALVGIK